MTREPIRTPVRLASAEELRLSGLLWPEARERLERTAWLAAERRGHGQVILFAAQPGFRGTHVATARLLANAVVLGPGLGAHLPLPRRGAHQASADLLEGPLAPAGRRG